MLHNSLKIIRAFHYKGYHRTSARTIQITLADAEIRSDVDFGFRRDHRKIK